jgi:transketolase
LENLTAIVIDNRSASQGWPGGIQRRFAVEGWASQRINGRDHQALAKALTTRGHGRPSVVVALTEARQ